jgi:branched-chain amino acid transport system permease protein
VNTGLLVAGGLDAATYWSVAFMIAAGLTVVFGMLGFLNAAHTSFFMLAGYVATSIASATGSFWAAMALAPVLVAAGGLALERAVLGRLYAAGHTAQLLLTIGLAYVIGEATKMLWGDSALTVAPPPSLAGHFSLLGATLPVYHLFVIAAAVALLGAAAAVLRCTRFGMVIRAAAANPDMTSALGFNVRDIHSAVFVIGIYLAAFAGVVMAPMAGVYPSMADDQLVQAFIVVVAGGLGSLPGAFIVALLLGLVQGFGNIFAADEAVYFPFMVLGAVLLFRPLGLFGARTA